MSTPPPSPESTGNSTMPSAPGYGQPQQGYAPQPPKKKGRFVKFGLLGCGGLIALVVLIVIVAAIASSGSTSTDSAAAEDEVAAAAEDAPAGEAAAEDEGSEEKAPAEDAKYSLKISSVERAAEVGDEYFGSQAQGEYVVIKYSFSNTSDESLDLSSSEMTLVGADGTEYSESSDAMMAFPDEYAVYETVNPGNTYEGVVVYDVPAGTDATTLSYQALFSFDGPIEVAIP